MAVLNWREVGTPNFGGTASALNTFGNLLNNSTQGLSDALGNFGKAQDAIASRQVLEQAMRYTDPQAYQRALANGEITASAETGRVDPATLNALMSRVGTLQNQAGDQQRFDANAEAMQLARAQRAAQERAMPSVRDFFDSKGLTIPDGLNFSDSLKLVGDMSNTLANQQRLEQGDLGLQRDRLLLEDAVRKDADGKIQRQAQQDIGGIFDAGGAIDYMSKPAFQSKTEGEKLIYRNAMESKFGPLFGTKGTSDSITNNLTSGIQTPVNAALSAVVGSPASVGAAGPVSVGGGYDTVVGNQKTSKPITSMTVGEVIAEGKNSWIPATKGNAALGLGANEGSSAAGRYQITGQTLAEFGKKVYGDGWDSQPFSPEVQDKVGEAIFNARKDGVLSDTWTALKGKNTPPEWSTKGFFKDKSWNEVKDLIAQKETGGVPVGSNPAAALTAAVKPATLEVPNSAAVAATGNKLAVEGFQLAGTDFDINELSTTQKDRTSAASVAAKMRSDGTVQIGETTLRGAIERVAREGKVTPATAGALIARAATETGGLTGAVAGPVEFFGGSVRGNNQINKVGLERLISDLKGTALEDRLAQQQSLQSNVQSLATVQTERSRLATEVAQLQAQVKAEPRLQSQLDAKQRELAAAGQNLARINAKLATEDAPEVVKTALAKTGKPVPEVARLQAQFDNTSPFNVSERTRIRRELELARAAQ